MRDDTQLIDETLQGDTVAFGLLVRKYQDRLYNTVVHVVGCREQAEDVVQDAFIQAYVKLHTFQGNSAYYTWLYRIAFNTAISHQRRTQIWSTSKTIAIAPLHQRARATTLAISRKITVRTRDLGTSGTSKQR